MKGVIADVNIQGYVDYLVLLMGNEPWKLFWDHLSLQYLHFSDVGLVQKSLDSVVWDTCQREEMVLITDNRNRKGQNSLQATIQQQNRLRACLCLPLPIFRICGRAERMQIV